MSILRCKVKQPAAAKAACGRRIAPRRGIDRAVLDDPRSVQFIRLLRIFLVALRFGLAEFAIDYARPPVLRTVLRVMFARRGQGEPRATRLRRAFETLGPIFVKFGQALSTRRDLLPADIADELAKLQDRVPPFASEAALREVERGLGKPIDVLFTSFDPHPVASASIAQVHFAVLPNGREVAVKILRPGVSTTIGRDIALLRSGALVVEKLWAEGRRLKPLEVVGEFEKYLDDELDLVKEAANASQLRRNFAASALLLVPEVYWDYCATNVMVMERMFGTPISRVDELRSDGIDVQRLARNGVEIFFTQVFRDGYFHADMHPGNIFVAADGRYIALDFGIMGTLNDTDKHFLAQNFLAFFQRDYRRVALAHVEAGWAPADTRVEEFESAIRAVCEPIFARPLREISFGRLLLRLFQTSRRFNIPIQPQLVLLQKTLINIEGLGRQLDPDLDLWKTAKPFLERWMSEQIGWRGVMRNLAREAAEWSTILPELPRLVHRALRAGRHGAEQETLVRLVDRLGRIEQALVVLAFTVLVIVVLAAILFVR